MRVFLFSTNTYFIEAFSSLIAKRRHDIELACYSDEAFASVQVMQGKYSIVLCEQGYLKECVGQTFYIELGNSTIMPKEERVGRLNIYQRADLIMEDLEHILSIAEGGTGEYLGGGKRISFFSTEGGSGKTTIAYLTAVTTAKRYKTMYWNLGPLADTDNLYHMNFQHSMEEILYAQHEKVGVLELLYETISCNDDGVYVLPGIRSLGDYKSFAIENIKELCECIIQTGIEMIILDWPSYYNGAIEGVMNSCDKIVWVYGSAESSLRKENAVKSDPYMAKVMGKSVFVRNKSQQKETGIISFPVSSTMQKANQISKVLEVNPEFANGCLAIEKSLQ